MTRRAESVGTTETDDPGEDVDLSVFISAARDDETLDDSLTSLPFDTSSLPFDPVTNDAHETEVRHSSTKTCGTLETESVRHLSKTRGFHDIPSLYNARANDDHETSSVRHSLKTRGSYDVPPSATGAVSFEAVPASSPDHVTEPVFSPPPPPDSPPPAQRRQVPLHQQDAGTQSSLIYSQSDDANSDEDDDDGWREWLTLNPDDLGLAEPVVTEDQCVGTTPRDSISVVSSISSVTNSLYSLPSNNNNAVRHTPLYRISNNVNNNMNSTAAATATTTTTTESPSRKMTSARSSPIRPIMSHSSHNSRLSREDANDGGNDDSGSEPAHAQSSDVVTSGEEATTMVLSIFQDPDNSATNFAGNRASQNSSVRSAQSQSSRTSVRHVFPEQPMTSGADSAAVPETGSGFQGSSLRGSDSGESFAMVNSDKNGREVYEEDDIVVLVLSKENKSLGKCITHCFVRPSATKSGRPYGVTSALLSWRTPPSWLNPPWLATSPPRRDG